MVEQILDPEQRFANPGLVTFAGRRPQPAHQQLLDQYHRLRRDLGPPQPVDDRGHLVAIRLEQADAMDRPQRGRDLAPVHGRVQRSRQRLGHHGGVVAGQALPLLLEDRDRGRLAGQDGLVYALTPQPLQRRDQGGQRQRADGSGHR